MHECSTLGRMGNVGNLAGSAFVPLAAATGVVASAGSACARDSPHFIAAHRVTGPTAKVQLAESSAPHRPPRRTVTLKHLNRTLSATGTGTSAAVSPQQQ